ncbi:hypothetical protein COO91_06844 [Nostoc flagelliforme CCNUN1]|uniref:Uncharacterized protein n=1 Tax=Nostoc flagelliforme CCNUN1 TaxID=2038116 RepID=A0A2K8T1D9_9NOSO|nr:hypothetical protein COO91_06844 [Nostoc flagelliforme CCNUN1]
MTQFKAENLKWLRPSLKGTAYIDFFQFDTITNTRKGIIAIDLQRWKP